MLRYKVDILGHTWLVSFMTKKAFEKEYGSETLGATVEEGRSIHLRTDHLNIDTVIHELMHAYISEHCAATMDLSTDQLEELCCDIVAKYAKKMVEQGEQVLHSYKVLKGRRVR